MKKKTHKILSYLLILCMILGIQSVNTFADVTPVVPGTDTDGVYQIGTAEELLWFQQYVKDGNTASNAVLTADIDLSLVCSETLGSWNAISDYAGKFDGQGHSISNLYINATVIKQGLFATVTSNGSIRNLGIKNAKVLANTNIKPLANYQVAALVGYNKGTISSCFVENTNVITKAKSLAKSGVLCGCNEGMIENCYCTDSTFTEEANRLQVGGICGSNSGTIANCYTANITLNSTATSQVASICGGAADSFTKCYYLSTDKEDKNATSWTAEQFKSADAITSLGDAYTFRNGENNNYPVLIFGLKSADKTTISAIITDATTISNSGIYYTEDDHYNGIGTSKNGFWTDFQTVLTSASEINADKYAKQEDVDAAASNLTEAAVKLIPKDNINATDLYDELQTSNSKAEAEYTATSWSQFEAARTTAQAIFAKLYDADKKPTEYNSSTTGTAVADVASATMALTAARENLCLASESSGYSSTVNSTKTKIETLKNIINRDFLKEADYTSASWAAYQAALTAADAAPVLTGTSADQTAVNNYKAAYVALYKAYYSGLQPAGKITVGLAWNDRIASKAYRGEVTLSGDYSLAAVLTQKGLTVSHPGGRKYVYINDVYIDNNYGRGDDTSGNTPDIVLHPGDRVSILWNTMPETLQSPTIVNDAPAEFWQYKDCLKVPSFAQQDGVAVEAGKPLTLGVNEVLSAFDADRKSVPAEGLSLYVGDIKSSAEGTCTVTPVAIDGKSVTTNKDGNATVVFYEEGWHLVAAYDMRSDIKGDLVQWPEGADQKAGTYYSANSGTLIWVHVTASSDPAVVKAGLKTKLDTVYGEYPENYFRPEDWSPLKTAYDTAVAGISSAASIGEAYQAQQVAIVAIKKVQNHTTNENTANLEILRGYLDKLPDNKALLSQSVANLVDSSINTYNGLSDYQKTRMTTVEIEKCEMLIQEKAEGLPAAKSYNLSYEIKADTPEATAAIEDMIQYLQDNNTIKDWNQKDPDTGNNTQSEDLGSVSNQKKDDADKLLQFDINGIKNQNAADPVVQVGLPVDMGKYAYLLVRQDEDHCITTTGAAWTISDDNFKFGEVNTDFDTLGYHVIKNMTVKINGTEYELKSIKYEGIDDAGVGFKDTSFIDRTTYKGKDKEQYVNVIFDDSWMYFTMPYEDVKATFNWGTVGSNADIAAAKSAAISDLQDKYASFDLTKYDDSGKAKLLTEKNTGEANVNAATILDGIAEARKVALAAMMAVQVKPDAGNPGQLPDGVKLPDYGDVVGQVKVSVRNDTYKGGAFTGKIIDGWYDLCKKDTMMTSVLKALATEGYTWKGTGGTGGDYDYDITYLASIKKGNKELAEFSGESGSGWMGTLNDWFVNEGFNMFSAKNRKLENGDVIEVQYTQNLGKDLGATWNSSDTSLKSLALSGGILTPSFKGSTKAYTLLIDGDKASVILTPTANNKNYLVKTFLNNYNRDSAYYKGTESISVKDGDAIYVGVGEKSWPSMNSYGAEAISYEPTKYTITVRKSGAESVITLIAELPDESRISFANYSRYTEQIEAARKAYDALSNKSAVTNYAKLTATEAKIQYYTKITNVKTLLAAIPSASKITLAHKDAVMAADAAYNELNKEQKKYITVGDVTNYNAAIDRLTELGAFSKSKKPSKIGGSTEEEIPTETVLLELKPETVIIGNEGKATISVEDASKAIEELKKENGNELLIQPKLTKIVDKLTIIVPKSTLKEVADDTKAVVTVKSNVTEMTFSKETLQTIARESGTSVSITAEKTDNSKLSEENKKLVGDKPVFNLSIEVDNKPIKNFTGKIRIALPYTIKKDENVKKLTAFYIDENGKATEMTGAYYDEKAAAVIFDTDHFSTFVIVYNEKKMIFKDVKADSWYYDAINFVTNNNLFNGVSDNTFAPNEKMTRAMLVTVLYRMDQATNVATGSAVTTTGSAVTTAKNTVKNFTDVKTGSWYVDAVKWASENGIADGYSDIVFGCNDSVTREQLAAILQRYAKLRGKDVTKKADLSAYKDKERISTYANDAMGYAVENKIVTGRTIDTLAPKGTATRAEVATMLMRYQ